MKLKITLAFLAICLFNPSFGQDREKYLKLIKKAQILYGNKAYEKSAQKYTDAFIAFGNQGERRHRYKAACAWAMSNEIDSSFVRLYKISKNGSYSDYEHISTDTCLNGLHQDKRWKKILKFVIRNKKVKKKADAKLDKNLIVILDTIFKRDRTPRMESRQIEKEYGRISDEMKAHRKTMRNADSINLIEVKRILDKRGWLGSDIIGRRGNQTLYLVIQHANLKTQEIYLPMMRKAVKKGNAKASELAFLEDRIAVRQGNKQVYGSQIGRNKQTGEYFIKPIIAPDHVDKRRSKIGLGKLSDYVSHWNISWDIEKHKKKDSKN